MWCLSLIMCRVVVMEGGGGGEEGRECQVVLSQKKSVGGWVSG